MSMLVHMRLLLLIMHILESYVFLKEYTLCGDVNFNTYIIYVQKFKVLPLVKKFFDFLVCCGDVSPVMVELAFFLSIVYYAR